MTTTHQTPADARSVPYTLTDAGRDVTTAWEPGAWEHRGQPITPRVARIVDMDTYSVDIDLGAHLLRLAQGVIEAARREEKTLGAALASVTGSTTPATQGRPLEVAHRIVAAWTRRGLDRILIDPAAAGELAQALDDASLEPGPCGLPSCEWYALDADRCGRHGEQS